MTKSHGEMETCPECLGEGEIEVETFHPHSADRDYGDASCDWIKCWACGGDGEFEKEPHTIDF